VSEFFFEYGLFLAKTVTLVIAVLALVGGIVFLASRGRDLSREKLEIKKVNDKFQQMSRALQEELLAKEELKTLDKEEKKEHKKRAKEGSRRQRLFVLDFDGDIKASALESLREEITAVLTVAKPEDEVFIKLQSGGGLVHAYGLAASQLNRVRERNIPLTVAVDKIAASGGYMMACVADRIIAAPFAIIGSIGVIAQIPNFHRLLKNHDIDFEQITAGEFKRTLTLFGENTDKAREKFKEEIEDTHALFKEFISEHRPQVDIESVATGEHWPASRAINYQLVDELTTSDDYLLRRSQEADIFEISYNLRKPLAARLGGFVQSTIEKFLLSRPTP